MKTQRLVGISLGTFSLLVLVGHFSNQSLSVFDALYGWFIPLFFASSFVDHFFFRFSQVAMIVGAGIVCIIGNDSGNELSAFFFSQGFILAFVHGFLDRDLPTKATVYAAFIFGIFYAFSFELRVPFLLLALCFFTTLFQWFVVQHFVEKAKKLDAIENDELFKKFKLAVEAGLSIADQDDKEGDDATRT